MTNQEIRNLLKKHNLRATTARVGVFYALIHTERPLSHSELVHKLSEMYGDQATIYRTLITFVDREIIRVASNVGGIARYECIDLEHKSKNVHPHFVCKACGIVSCLPKTTIIHTLDEAWKDILYNSEIQFLGTCQDCA